MTSTEPTGSAPADETHGIGWLHPGVIAAAVFSVYSGFAQFSATASLPDIAEAFGQTTDQGLSLAEQIGLSGTTLGIGLAIIRGASMAAQPLSHQADKFGRRRVLIAVTFLGLVLTTFSSLAPSFWFFVAFFALARPMMSTTNAVAGVIASEETRTKDRSKAIALVSVGYALGAGLSVVVRGFTPIGFRGLFALAGALAFTLPFVAVRLHEPERSARLHTEEHLQERLGKIPPDFRVRVVLLAVVSFAIAFLTGPFNTFLFVYGERVVNADEKVLAVVMPVAGVLAPLALLLGVRLADTIGRRPTAVIAQLTMCITGVVTYSGGVPAMIIGYLGSIMAGSMYAPAVGAMASEIVPTSVRATAAGWATFAGTVGAVCGLFLFGVAFDVLESFRYAAMWIAGPVVVSSIAFWYLPETAGLELEESAPDVV